MTIPPRMVISESFGKDSFASDLRDYVLLAARNPDPGSEFAQDLAALPEDVRSSDIALVNALLSSGRDGLLYLAEGIVAAHIFFQRKPKDGLHLFSLCVHKPWGGRGMTYDLVRDFLDFARSLGEPRVRLSRGREGHAFFRDKILPWLHQQARDLRITVDVNTGYVTLMA